ncbi:hypothetical protein L3Q82_004132 [Scortum barcoo]|uniref:Uncharacterized protein n=1 Tax=Scortum barcoo TaxID=214431 RepID=A0ACB8X6Z8_9TELE|nr:hypothetical protein L3Q82_004132 [Scortum barcoo]
MDIVKLNKNMNILQIFRNAVDPGDIAVMLEYETVRIELVQLTPPVGDTLASFEEDARRFLFPEPKLVPSFSGVDQEVLMTRAPHFPGIAPRLEFSSKTTIIECSADAEINIHPNEPLRSVVKRNRKPSSRPRTSSPQRKQPQTLGRRRGSRAYRDRPSSTRSQSLSPVRAGNSQRLARLSLGSDWDTAGASQPVSTDKAASFHFQSTDGRGELRKSQSVCLAPPLRSSIYQLLFTFDQVFIHRLERYPKMTPALQKHMIPLTTTTARTGNGPGSAGPFLHYKGPALTENGKRSKSVFEDSLPHQKLFADLSM